MSKMLSSKEIIAILERQGFVKKSQKGSHIKFVCGSRTVIVPHPKPTIPRGTFLSIVRQSGLTKEIFEE
jgi:predicted RNA binding protein YcfA (HicA-like mRNA interferase family)